MLQTTSMNNIKNLFTVNFLKHIIIPVIIVFLYWPISSYAIDEIKLSVMEAPNSINSRYKEDILLHALKATEKEYGAYAISFYPKSANNKRGIVELKSGKNINVYIAVPTEQWEENAIAIRIPIRRGISNYRLLMINKYFTERFNHVNSLGDLKKLRIGLRSGWAITSIFKEAGFNVIESQTFDGLLYMLENDRIDFIPRGINEIYPEIARRKNKVQSLVAHPKLAFTIPIPFYVFVSPTEPHLAKRLSQGIEKIYNNGTLEQLFNQYYADSIMQANIETRTIFSMRNHLLPESTPKNIADFWFYNDKKE